MFLQIFLFEIRYRLRRPGVWLCFFGVFLFSFFSFALGKVPNFDREFVNAPAVLAFYMAATSMPMMLISSAIMGVPLYRDIEYNTKEYYLSYPITKAGYFYGRFFGSFFFLSLIGAAVPLGAWLGSTIGKAAGWTAAARYGPQHLLYYLHPYLVIALPNMIFTSCLFFALVAATRNVKVIYSSGLILFLGYIIANFVLHDTVNRTVINLSDPFGITPVRLETGGYTLTQQNTSLVAIHGSFLANRLLWPGIGLIVLLIVYARFSFDRFFSGRADKKKTLTTANPIPGGRKIPAVRVGFTGNYYRRTLSTLTRIELLNIIRDNYFWIIMSAGMIFLGFIFWVAGGQYQVPDLRRTSWLLFMFNDNFIFFIFIILIFYTGETVHREKTTRYATIHDSLPPPNWLLNTSKLFSLLCLAAFLALVPMLLGIFVQLANGFTQLNFPIYFANLFAIDLPLFTEMVLFAYMLHIVMNNKFAAHGIGIVIWITLFLLQDSGRMNYLLFLYSYTPQFLLSDMDGIGHMAAPLFWFHLYWLLCGGLFLVLAALFYVRGVPASLSERWQLVKERWGWNTRIATFVLLVCFLGAGSYIYYNVSYRNDYTTRREHIGRAAIFEKTLKRYELLPLPSVTAIRMIADLYPDQRKTLTQARITVTNRTDAPIDSILLDGDDVSEYSMTYNGVLLPYSCPLIYPRGKFNLFKPRQDTAEYRLYRLPTPLSPGQEARIDIHSVVEYEGFANRLTGATYLHNNLVFSGGLPGLGYDAGDELGGHDDRVDYHLPEKKPHPIPHGDPRGFNKLSGGGPEGLYSLDITVSTSADQVIAAPGALLRQWEEKGRHYYHYVQDRPGMYFNLTLFSGKYATLDDSVETEQGRMIPIRFYFYPDHKANLDRFMAACKDGLRYYSRIYGPYPFDRLSVVESSMYAPDALLLPGMIVYSEKFGWNAHFTNPDQFDYCYFVTGRQLASQWWGEQIAPNNTVGSKVVSEGVAAYSALALLANRQGKEKMRGALGINIDGYNRGRFIAQRRHESRAERPLVNADRDYQWQHKAPIELFGLRDLIGEDSLNAALREFLQTWAFRSHPPYAGSDDLYRVLQRHVPDSFRYYLEDGWEKTCFYQNHMLEASAVPLGKDDEYRVTLRLAIGKGYVDSAGETHPAAFVNDYIDIGIFAADAKDASGRVQWKPLWMEKQRLTAGEHTLVAIVHGKPLNAVIDPYQLLLDDKPQDNHKEIEIR